MYIPHISPAWTASIISVTVSPLFASRGSFTPPSLAHTSANFARTSSLTTVCISGKNIGISPASDAPWTLFCPRKGCKPVPGLPIWPVINPRLIKQRELSVPWICCDTPIPQNIIPALASAKVRATSRITSGLIPQIPSIFSGENFFRCSLSASQFSVYASMYC